jgi:AraC-like DNA-binding protein
MRYEEHTAVGSLARFVRCIWTLEGDATEGAQEPVFPDGSPELIFNLADPFVARDHSGEFVEQPSCMLVGQITAPFFVRPTGAVQLIAFRLLPYGAAGLFDAMSSITESWVDMSVRLRSVWPEAVEQHRDGRSLEVLTERLSHRLTEELLNSRMPHPDVERACDAIHSTRGAVAIEDLAAQLGTTVRTLQRRFASQVGIPPKLLARITRFQHTFAAWRNDPRRLARVAADCGYFDQSHLVRDFRDFAGDAPAAALAAQPEFTSFFLP